MDPKSVPAWEMGLHWPIKHSFLAYLGRTPGSQCSTTRGASMINDGEFVFEPAASDAIDVLAFRGDVRFLAHGGFLFVRVAHPKLVMGTGRSQMLVDDPYDTDGTGNPFPLVTFQSRARESSTGLTIWDGIDVRLTDEGRGLFNDIYPEGEEFEQFTVVLQQQSRALP